MSLRVAIPYLYMHNQFNVYAQQVAADYMITDYLIVSLNSSSYSAKAFAILLSRSSLIIFFSASSLKI